MDALDNYMGHKQAVEKIPQELIPHSGFADQRLARNCVNYHSCRKALKAGGELVLSGFY
jgi:hypothetical protein